MDMFETQSQDGMTVILDDSTQSQKNNAPRKYGCIVFLLMCVAIVCVSFWYFFIPPALFPEKSYIRITQGETVNAFVTDAESKHVVRSKDTFKLVLELSGATRHMIIGDYYFDRPLGLVPFAGRITRGDFRLQQVRVTLPEGTTRKQMAALLTKVLPQFVSADFMDQTKNDEGYLFPDTYYFSPLASPTEVIARLKQNYENKVAPLREDIKASGMSEHDVITLASILEKEANGNEDRAIIAGILEKRLASNMALEVDASFVYLLGKESSQLTLADLKTDSPYNTYTHRGLPPTPIDNPGLASIVAVLHPTLTPYLFYLHDSKGVAHYAKTFDEHKKNKALYLR
jgi:UPF0755 protein